MEWFIICNQPANLTIHDRYQPFLLNITKNVPGFILAIDSWCNVCLE